MKKSTNPNVLTGYVIRVGNYTVGGTRGTTVGHWSTALRITKVHVISVQIRHQLQNHGTTVTWFVIGNIDTK